MNKAYRILVTFFAIGLGILLIYGLTSIGDRSKGPLEDIFLSAGDLVTDAEHYLMNEKMQRYKKLDWFSKARNVDKLKEPKLMLLGAFDNQAQQDFQSIIELENVLETTFPIIHIYTAWGSKAEQRFPLTQAKAIHELGSIPMVTWEPWLIDFDQKENPELRDIGDRDNKGLKDISEGMYDFYLQKWMLDLKKFDHPIFIRWGHEMNDPYRYTWGPQNNDPEDYVEAYRYVVDYFVKSGVSNIIWVWSPHIAYGSFQEYYPGDQYVDWVGVGALNYGTVASWSDWWTFDETFGDHYEALDTFGKPLMISEFGSLAVGGERDLWYQNAMCEMPTKYPNVKSVLFFHFNTDNTLTYQTLDWYFKDDIEITTKMKFCMEAWPEEIKGE